MNEEHSFGILVMVFIIMVCVVYDTACKFKARLTWRKYSNEIYDGRTSPTSRSAR